MIPVLPSEVTLSHQPHTHQHLHREEAPRHDPFMWSHDALCLKAPNQVRQTKPYLPHEGALARVYMADRHHAQAPLAFRPLCIRASSLGNDIFLPDLARTTRSPSEPWGFRRFTRTSDNANSPPGPAAGRPVMILSRTGWLSRCSVQIPPDWG
jgi:hypothetical protein